MDDLSERSDQEILSSIAGLIGSQHELTAKLVAHLAEIEERRLHLVAGFSSMFEFCVQRLKLSEGEAFRRILAARLGRRFPAAYALLATGRVHLSTLELLREWLTEENHEELFEAVAGKGKREVQAFLALRFPRPDRPSRIGPPTSIEPLAPARFLVEFTASDELRQKPRTATDAKLALSSSSITSIRRLSAVPTKRPTSASAAELTINFGQNRYLAANGANGAGACARKS
jgi:hypothetical protein